MFPKVPFNLCSLKRSAKSVSPNLCSHRYSNIVISSFWQLEYKSSYTQMTLGTSSLKRYYQKLTTEVSCKWQSKSTRPCEVNQLRYKIIEHSISRYNFKNHHHAAIIMKYPSHTHPQVLMNNHRKVNYWIASSSSMTWLVTANTVSSSDSYEGSKTQVLKVLLRNLATLPHLGSKKTLSMPLWKVPQQLHLPAFLQWFQQSRVNQGGLKRWHPSFVPHIPIYCKTCEHCLCEVPLN